MNISIATVFPELYDPFLQTSLIKRACKDGSVSITLDTLFSFVQPKERIDAPTYGPGSGMLIRPDVVDKAIQAAEQVHGPSFKIFFSPHGTKLDQNLCKTLARTLKHKKHMMLLPARYEGMDARVEEYYADMVLSIGDFVLMGGDIPAMVLLEGMLRYIPGVVGSADSVEHDSFSGPFVDYPEFTAPVEWKGLKVPDVVRSGNHQEIDAWRKAQSVERSVKKHFGWVQNTVRRVEDKQAVLKAIPPHYVMLCHSNVLVGQDRQPGVTSVTSLDIHDIARSSKTYGVKGYWLVTPLLDQQRVIQTFLDFWNSDVGLEYNAQRRTAIAHVNFADTVDQVMESIEEHEGKKPLLVATSARVVDDAHMISFFDQETVWQHGRPVVIVLGTGQGLEDQFVQRCDYVLSPICGLTAFNHLSVRSAAAIILDRWMGVHNKKV